MNDNSAASQLENLYTYLGRNIRIKIKDGRIIEGEFQCLDKNMNFILGSATEYHGAQDIDFTTDKSNFRLLGTVMVPGQHILSCHIESINV